MFKYRFLITWDHSTNWARNWGRGLEQGEAVPYLKPPEAFLADYYRLVDYCSAIGFNGVVLWGFLRDSHFGIEAGRSLCDYGLQRQVPILPGVGLYTYGGVYFDGDHPYCLYSWLEKNPHLRAVTPAGKKHPQVACPSLEENHRWMVEGLTWLLTEFPVGGIHLRLPQYPLCWCERCWRERKAWILISQRQIPEESLVIPFILDHLSRLVQEIYPLLRDRWLLVSLPMGFGDIPEIEKVPLLYPSASAEKVSLIWAWDVTEMIAQNCWPDGLRPPSLSVSSEGGIQEEHLAFARQGSQWFEKSRYQCVLPALRILCGKALLSGMQGWMVYGEVPPDSIANELNYLALATYSQNPYWDWSALACRMGDLYGGEEAAELFLRLLLQEEASVEAYQTASAMMLCMPHGAQKRWRWLVQRLEERIGLRPFSGP